MNFLIVSLLTCQILLLPQSPVSGFPISDGFNPSLVASSIVLDPVPMTSTGSTIYQERSKLATSSSAVNPLVNVGISSWISNNYNVDAESLFQPFSSSITLSSSTVEIQRSPSSFSSSSSLSTIDKVERVLDANTIQLERLGIVKLAGVRMPSPTLTKGFEFPSCFTYSPSYKLRQLLPSSTKVDVVTLDMDRPSSSTTIPSSPKKTKKIPSVILVRCDNSMIVNQELVRTGFAKVIMKPSSSSSSSSPANTEFSSEQTLLDYQVLMKLQDQAKVDGIGIFQRCNEEDIERDGSSTAKIVDSSSTSGSGWSTAQFQAEFEPLESTMETIWTDDGGLHCQRRRRQTTQTTMDIDDDVLASRSTNNNIPGSVKRCADFATYEDALAWYERGVKLNNLMSVAKLDRDGDGVPCPGLPHTTDRNKYRMKVPDVRKGMGTDMNTSQ